MKVLFAGQVPKDSAYPDANEDAYALAIDEGRVALCDGASESFDSKRWANLVSRRFVQTPGIQGEWLNELTFEYLAQFDVANLTWSKQAAFERGSFATLLALASRPSARSVDVLAIGDSIAILLNGTSFLDAYPYTSASDFQNRPELLATRLAHNAFIHSPEFDSTHRKTWPLEGYENPLVLCMTDALGEWALRNAQEGNPRWETLGSIRCAEELENLVLAERTDKRMRVDDVTLLTIAFKGISDHELSHT